MAAAALATAEGRLRRLEDGHWVTGELGEAAYRRLRARLDREVEGLRARAAEAARGRALAGLPELSGGAMLIPPMLTERGARAVGLWPSDDPYELLVALLDRQIAAEDSDDERTRLQRLRATVRDVGKGTVTALLVELIKAGATVRL